MNSNWNNKTRIFFLGSLLGIIWFILWRGYYLILIESRNNWGFYEPTLWLIIATLISMIIAGIIIDKFSKYNSENILKSKKVMNGVYISLVASFVLIAIRFIVDPNGQVILSIKSFLFHAFLGSVTGTIIQLNLKNYFKKYSGQ